MISFKADIFDSCGNIKAEFFSSSDVNAESYIKDIVSEFAHNSDDEVEYAFAAAHGCLLIRVFDMGRYCFLFPYEIEDGADISEAIKEMADYAMREEIAFVVSDVPGALLGCFVGFRHMKIDSEDENSESYRVTVETECDLIDEIPCEAEGRVELTPIFDEDESEYARLCKDKNVNKYWGYDYSSDVSNPDDSYFLNEARREFLCGVSMPFAVRCDGVFCGEAVIYAFDGRGGAEIAVRLFSEYQGQGIGSAVAKALVRISRSIGLMRLYAKVMKKNRASIRFTDSFMDAAGEENGTVSFILNLY